MRIIKGSRPAESPWFVEPPAPQASPRGALSDDPLGDAQATAQALLEAAQRDAERLREEARKEGFQQGYQQGQEAATQELEEVWKELLQNIHNETCTMQDNVDRVMTQAEEDVARLALAITAKILKTEVLTSVDYVVPIAQAALAKLVGRTQVTLFLNPADHARIEEYRLMLPNPETLKIASDPRIGAGGCRITTECGQADATFHQQLSAIAKAMLDDLGFAEPALESLHEPRTLPHPPQDH